MHFKQFFSEMAYSTGSVPSDQKTKLEFDNYDKELYTRFSVPNETDPLRDINGIRIRPNNRLAAMVILGRYGYLRKDLQEKAIQSGVYFEKPGLLIVNDRQIPINSHMGELNNRIRNLIPMLARWGGRNPASRTGIDPERLERGINLNYHAKAHYETSGSMWEDAGFNSEKEFMTAFLNLNKAMVVPLEYGEFDTGQLKDQIYGTLEANLPEDMSPNIKKDLIKQLTTRVLHAIYLKLGKLEHIKNPLTYLKAIINNNIKDNLKYINHQGLRNAGDRSNFFDVR